MSWIDAGKFVRATLVIISHLGSLNSCGQELNYYVISLSFRYAVLFLFLCSGCFLDRGILLGKYFGKYITRVLLLYSLWTVIYILFNMSVTLKIKFSKVLY